MEIDFANIGEILGNDTEIVLLLNSVNIHGVNVKQNTGLGRILELDTLEKKCRINIIYTKGGTEGEISL